MQPINTIRSNALSLSYFAISAVILGIYGTEVCPYIDSLDNSIVFLIFGVVFSTAALFKLMLEPWLVDRVSPVHRPSYQFYFDLGLYILVGISIAGFNSVFFQFPAGSGVKVIMGCLTLGAFAGLDNALYRERKTFLTPADADDSEKIYPMTRKLSLVFGLMGILTVIVVALVVINDMDFMMKNRLSMGTEDLQRIVFIDIGFVIGVLIVLSLKLIRSFARNLDYLLNLQINTLDHVAAGELETFVPLITRDEFRLIAAKTNAMIKGLQGARKKEEALMQMTQDVSSEIELTPLLKKIVMVVSEFLDADRSSLFLYDRKSNELWSMVAEELDAFEIRIARDEGLVGYVFSSGETVRIKDAYADQRFNSETDLVTGYRTRSVLCMPIHDKKNQPIGVIQAVNKRDGVFTADDERRLRAFCAQAAITLVNAQLYDEVNNMKNYDESVLKSLSNGVVTLDQNHNIAKVNDAALKILKEQESIVGRPVAEIFHSQNDWVAETLKQVLANKEPVLSVDANIHLPDNRSASVNLTTVPLVDLKNDAIGAMLVIDDITTEKRVRSTMSRYMPSAVADRLLENPEHVLGGVMQQVSVVFSDIRGFTSLSERLGARETVSLLNNYFSVMVDRIEQNNGILDKYMGDGIMAIFGAPFSTVHDADNAVLVAIEMMQELRQFNISLRNTNQDSIDVGIGISSGEVVLGNIGSMKRMEYTAIGDTVNLAARLEGATKLYAARILVSEFTKAALTKSYMLRDVDRIRVKGKEKPVVIYEVLDYHTAETFPNMNESLGFYKQGLIHYNAKDWKQSFSAFQSALAKNPKDGLSQEYLNRCEHFLSHPPDSDWDGVWTMTSK